MPNASSMNYPPNYPAAPVEMVDLQQQVARLQALLETSRQVHSAVRLEELLSTVLRIVVRELELRGALITEPHMVYGSMPPEPFEDCPRFPLQTKDGHLLAELMVALSRFAADHADSIAEVDLNPVIVHPAGEGLTIVDALIVKS